MEPSGSSSRQDVIPPNTDVQNSDQEKKAYPLEPKPGISCIPHQYESPSTVRIRSATIINPNVSVRLEVIYKRHPDHPSMDWDSSSAQGTSMEE